MKQKFEIENIDHGAITGIILLALVVAGVVGFNIAKAIYT